MTNFCIWQVVKSNTEINIFVEFYIKCMYRDHSCGALQMVWRVSLNWSRLLSLVGHVVARRLAQHVELARMLQHEVVEGDRAHHKLGRSSVLQVRQLRVQ